ncbi:MAG: bifunctional folylpolyglutamate synthase/dihydrofolate synthase [Bacteroidetes bacterium]|nr:bifunctional folylpolyglutamate synthase/dihydrofolate synthase [Bacteroidota bacterium]
MNPTIEYLFSLHTFGMKFGLRNIRSLLHFCGDPHHQLRTVHIAGTNGKGSTSSIIASILTAAGYSVGLYTSPHLVSFNERIRINGVMIPEKDLVRYVRKLRPEIERLHATFFEATTAIAFRYFADQQVDIAVIETGLGGRLDSTNVLRPMVSVITSIGKDHTQQLGTTLYDIASEKAGIIKRNIPIVMGNLTGVARKTIIEAAKKKHSPWIAASKINAPKGIQIELKGIHQRANARTALATISLVTKHFLIGDQAVKQGLEQTSALSGLRARYEFHKGHPDVVLDVAHNPDGIKTLVTELSELTYQRIVILFAVMKDKDYRSMLKQFKKLHPVIVATQPAGERALPSGVLHSVCQSMGFHSYETKNLREAYQIAKKKSGQKGLLIVTGSHYLIGEVIPLIEKKP